jgi:hypothetical protein
MGVIRFGRTLPALLVVIGLVKILQSSTNTGTSAPPAAPGGTPPSEVLAGEVQPPNEVKHG